MSYLVQRAPTRIVPSGTSTLAAGTTILFPGTNARQNRLSICVTNLNETLPLKLCTPNGVAWDTVQPLTTHTHETNADVLLSNPGGSDIDYEVGEFYPDDGNRPRNTTGGSAPGFTGYPAGIGVQPDGGMVGVGAGAPGTTNPTSQQSTGTPKWT